MIIYKTCTHSTMSEIFEAFSIGFSDYFIPLTMSQSEFTARFFGPEGNSLNTSFIALDDNKPIGVILGGIRQFDGLKTMRCGSLCIHPDYRGRGISQRLFEMHKAAALEAKCKQLFLEVIKHNHRAVKFYETCGYTKVYSLKYFSIIAQYITDNIKPKTYSIEPISFDELNTFKNSLPDCHINWQSDTPYYAESKEETLLCAYDNGRQIALLALNPHGKINFLWVAPDYRGQGVGKGMLSEAIKLRNIEKITICLPSNSSMEGFVRKLGFEKDSLEQYEMYLPL